MELKTLTCPSCGASLQIPEGKDRFFCTFCGSQIQVDDGKITIDINANVNVNQRYTDVARMRELDLQEKEQERLEDEKNRIRRWKLYWVLILLGTIIIYILCMYICSAFDSSFRNVAGVFAGVIAFVSPITLFLTRPKDWRKTLKESKQSGCSDLIVKFIVWFFVALFWVSSIILPIVTVM